MFWVTVGRGGRAVLQLVVSGLCRLLTPAQFGVVSAALVVIGFSAIFSEVGLGPAIVQRPDLQQRHIEAAFTGSILFGFIVGAVVWLAAPLAADFFQIEQVAPVLRVLAWIFPLKGVAVVPESLLQRDLKFRALANRDVVSYGVGYGLVGVVLAWRGLGVWALVGGQLAQAALNTTLLVIARPTTVSRRVDWSACRELALFGGGFTAARVSNYLAVQGDNLVVGRWLGPAALGIYGRAYQLMAMPAVVFGTILDTVLFPVMAKVQGNPQQLRTAYRRGISLIALVMLPASVVLVILAPELVSVPARPPVVGCSRAVSGPGGWAAVPHQLQDERLDLARDGSRVPPGLAAGRVCIPRDRRRVDRPALGGGIRRPGRRRGSGHQLLPHGAARV